MIEVVVKVINQAGIHTRPAANIVKAAAKFKSEIFLARDGYSVNAKSIMGVMMLAAAKGSFVTLEASGTDEKDAIDALTALIADYFGEGE